MKILQAIGVCAVLALGGCGGSKGVDPDELNALEGKVLAQINSGTVRDPQDLAATVFLMPDFDTPGRFEGYAETRGGRQADLVVIVEPGTQHLAIQWPTPTPEPPE